MLSIAQQIYYKWDICHKKSTSDDSRFTGVLSESKVDLNPHQVEAALFAFKSPLSKGAILADEVGLGKTIEAGILLSEFWAEHKRHILVIVPASLRNQWSMELLEKFYLPSLILVRSSYEEIISKKSNPFAQDDLIVICSYQFAVTHATEISEVQWDLIVIDEAHKLRNVYKKKNIMSNVLKDTLHPFKKVLLTATPLQNSLRELYGLISIIDDEFFASAQTFEEQYDSISIRDKSKYGELKSRIAHIVHRTLRSQVNEYVKYTNRIPFVQEYVPSVEEQKLYDAVSDYLFREGTFGIPEIVRPMLSLLYRKIMSSSAYALSFTLKSTIARLERIKEHGQQVSTMRFLLDDLDNVEEECEVFSYDTSILSKKEIKQIDNEVMELRRYASMAESIKVDVKAKALLKALSVSFDKVQTLGGQRKALIFTESCRTQDFLKNFLESNGYHGKVVCFNGTNKGEEANDIYRKWLTTNVGSSCITGNSLIDKKQSLVDFFKDSAEIMIATEAGAEGINLQFCSLVINYDMPWNPQRIEQRIGRCHRYGQKHDVVVVNFLNKANAADCRVYDLLASKFNLFDGVFGSSDEILGSIDSSFDIEGKLNQIFRTCRTETEINAAFDELQKKLESVISERINDTKKTLLENFDEDVVGKLKVRQENDALRIDRYIRHFWKLALAALKGHISHIDADSLSFSLDENITENIKRGFYTFNKADSAKMQIRSTSPIGNYILDRFSMESSIESIVFDLSSYLYRSLLLEEYKGESGWLVAYNVVSVNSYDTEETIIFCPITDKGEVLPQEFGEKIMDLPVSSCTSYKLPKNIEEKISSILAERLERHKDEVNVRTEKYANYEIEKYEAWSDDQLVPLQKQVIDARKEKDDLHKQLRKERDVRNKLLLKRQEMALADKLSKMQRHLFEMEDKYRQNVDRMTSKLLESLDNHFESKILFAVKWTIL